MKRIYYISMVAAGLFLMGCNKLGVSAGSETIRFDVQHPGTKATDTAFESGDRFGLYITEYDGDKPGTLMIGGNFKNNVPVTFDGSSWSSNPPLRWNEGKYDMYAYYPYGNPTSTDKMKFAVALDQGVAAAGETLSGYEASDLMMAISKGVTASDGAVKLGFKHKLSKVTVRLEKGEDYEGDLPENAAVYVHNTIPECLVDLSTGDVVKDPDSSYKTIVARKLSSGLYTAIIVPQMLTYKVPVFEVVCEGVSYLVDTKFNFKQGVNHEITLVLTDNPEKVKIEIGGSLNEW